MYIRTQSRSRSRGRLDHRPRRLPKSTPTVRFEDTCYDQPTPTSHRSYPASPRYVEEQVDTGYVPRSISSSRNSRYTRDQIDKPTPYYPQLATTPSRYEEERVGRSYVPRSHVTTTTTTRVRSVTPHMRGVDPAHDYRIPLEYRASTPVFGKSRRNPWSPLTPRYGTPITAKFPRSDRRSGESMIRQIFRFLLHAIPTVLRCSWHVTKWTYHAVDSLWQGLLELGLGFILWTLVSIFLVPALVSVYYNSEDKSVYGLVCHGLGQPHVLDCPGDLVLGFSDTVEYYTKATDIDVSSVLPHIVTSSEPGIAAAVSAMVGALGNEAAIPSWPHFSDNIDRSPSSSTRAKGSERKLHEAFDALSEARDVAIRRNFQHYLDRSSEIQSNDEWVTQVQKDVKKHRDYVVGHLRAYNTSLSSALRIFNTTATTSIHALSKPIYWDSWQNYVATTSGTSVETALRSLEYPLSEIDIGFVKMTQDVTLAVREWKKMYDYVTSNIEMGMKPIPMTVKHGIATHNSEDEKRIVQRQKEWRILLDALKSLSTVGDDIEELDKAVAKGRKAVGEVRSEIETERPHVVDKPAFGRTFLQGKTDGLQEAMRISRQMRTVRARVSIDDKV